MFIHNLQINTKIRGFSLIELMAVVTIVAILSLIAAPIYRDYSTSARLYNVQTFVEKLVDQASIYVNLHGTFPTAGQLGLASNPASAQINSASSINPYLWVIWANDEDRETGGTACGRAGYISGAINAGSVGLIDIGPDAMYFSCIMANINKKIQTKCFYSYPNHASSGNYSLSYANGVNHSAGLKNLMLDWTHDNTGENDHDYTNFSSYVTYVQANSQCMH